MTDIDRPRFFQHQAKLMNGKSTLSKGNRLVQDFIISDDFEGYRHHFRMGYYFWNLGSPYSYDSNSRPLAVTSKSYCLRIFDSGFSTSSFRSINHFVLGLICSEISTWGSQNSHYYSNLFIIRTVLQPTFQTHKYSAQDGGSFLILFFLLSFRQSLDDQCY